MIKFIYSVKLSWDVFLLKMYEYKHYFAMKLNKIILIYTFKNSLFNLGVSFSSTTIHLQDEKTSDAVSLPKQQHNFHIVDVSPWPLLTSLFLFGVTSTSVSYFHHYVESGQAVAWNLAFLVLVAFFWWRDVIREGTFLGHHTKEVQQGLKLGMILFIVSEVMFFFSFFWAFFHSSIAPTIAIGSLWPPFGINVLNTWKVPLLNTTILILSGFTITWAHYGILISNKLESILSLFITIGLAYLFTSYQGCEYLEADYNISDGIYGSIFYMATGFHGFHVIIGTIFICVCLIRVYYSHFSSGHHVGFESAAWYWHFVDVVWLILFICVYWWGNGLVKHFEKFFYYNDFNSVYKIFFEGFDGFYYLLYYFFDININPILSV